MREIGPLDRFDSGSAGRLKSSLSTALTFRTSCSAVDSCSTLTERNSSLGVLATSVTSSGNTWTSSRKVRHARDCHAHLFCLLSTKYSIQILSIHSSRTLRVPPTIQILHVSIHLSRTLRVPPTPSPPTDLSDEIIK